MASVADAPCIHTLPAMPDNVMFGSVVIGGTSARTTITVTNAGTCSTEPLSVGLVGSHAPEFGIADQQCLGRDLAPLETCTLAVFFQPTSVGAKTATLSISARPLRLIVLEGSAVSGAR